MRLFVAVELSDDVKASLRKVQRSLSRFDRAVRWTGEEQMHLTFKFLGEVPDAQVSEACSAAEVAANASSPFEMALEGCGCFPPEGPVRVVWAGLRASGPELAACQRRCEAAYAALGFEPERRAFTPHMTLGRVRHGHRPGGLRAAAASAMSAPASQAVESICVIGSTLTPRGAQYAVVSRHRLGATGPAGG